MDHGPFVSQSEKGGDILKRIIFIVAVMTFVFVGVMVSAEDLGAEVDRAIVGTYTVNDGIYVNRIGEPEGKPITLGYMDHKPVWSKTGGKIVFFRVKKYSQSIALWEDAICVINTDGTGYKEVTDGRHHDYNPTWMRDGSNRIIFNRYKNGRSRVYITTPDANHGEEQLISDPKKSEYAHSALKDGRILITSNRSITKGIVFLLTPNPGQLGKYELVNFDYKLKGLPDRASFSPGENKITYELNRLYRGFSYNNHPLVVADFDPVTITCSNPVVFTKAREEVCDIYPRFVKDGHAIIYQSNRSGRWQLYQYDLNDASTRCVSTNASADYRYFCGEDSPY